MEDLPPFYKGPPMLFETMVFGGDYDQRCVRCSTWAEAEAQHNEAVRNLVMIVHLASDKRLTVSPLS